MAQTYSRTATWEDPNPVGTVMSYRLYLGKQSGDYSKVVQIGPEDQQEAFSLDEPGVWFAAITALNADGESEKSEETTFKVGPPLKQLALTIQI